MPDKMRIATTASKNPLAILLCFKALSKSTGIVTWFIDHVTSLDRPNKQPSQRAENANHYEQFNERKSSLHTIQQQLRSLP
jgi:hypothetical protein